MRNLNIKRVFYDWLIFIVLLLLVKMVRFLRLLVMEVIFFEVRELLFFVEDMRLCNLELVFFGDN